MTLSETGSHLSGTCAISSQYMRYDIEEPPVSCSPEDHRFMQPSGSVGGKHMPASPLNLALLAAYGIDRVAVLTRDPRDCTVASPEPHCDARHMAAAYPCRSRLGADGLITIFRAERKSRPWYA